MYRSTWMNADCSQGKRQTHITHAWLVLSGKGTNIFRIAAFSIPSFEFESWTISWNNTTILLFPFSNGRDKSYGESLIHYLNSSPFYYSAEELGWKRKWKRNRCLFTQPSECSLEKTLSCLQMLHLLSFYVLHFPNFDDYSSYS